MQDDERRRLATEVPLTVLTLPDRHRAGLDASDIERLADRWAANGSLDTEPPPPESAEPAPAPSEGGEPHSIDTMIAQASVIVCCGSGGVGKTTTAAAIGLRATAAGRRVVVVTIDPARRLADALGLVDGLAAAPQRIELTEDSGVDGEMWAMMLDAEATFDDLVRREAGDDAQVDRILSNRFYRNIAGALSGTQEYMASEMLHQLHVDERFDLVVVDTPPSRNALDFLEAPGVLARFLDHRVFKLMMLPTKGGLRIIGTASQPILRAIGRVVGSDVLADSVAFFQAFAGMEAGFRERAAAVMALDPRRCHGVRDRHVAAPRHHRRGRVVRRSARRAGGRSRRRGCRDRHRQPGAPGVRPGHGRRCARRGGQGGGRRRWGSGRAVEQRSRPASGP